MVEGYREYGEGQQTYQVYIFERIGGIGKRTGTEQNSVLVLKTLTARETDSKSGALIGFLVRVQDPSPGAKESRLAPVKTTSASYIFLAPPVEQD